MFGHIVYSLDEKTLQNTKPIRLDSFLAICLNCHYYPFHRFHCLSLLMMPSFLNRLGACNLTGESCNNLAPALSQNVKSYLKELDLSFNNLTDSGMKMLEPWLTNKHCELLRLG